MRLARCSWNPRPSPRRVQVPVFIPAFGQTPSGTVPRDEPEPPANEAFYPAFPSADLHVSRWLLADGVSPEACILGLAAVWSPPGWDRVESVSFGSRPGVHETASGTLRVVLPESRFPRTAFERFIAFWDAAARLRSHLGFPDRPEESRRAAQWIATLPSLRADS